MIDKRVADKKPRILDVDDGPETRQMLDSWLTDYEVNGASNQEEARVTICDDMPHLGISGKTPETGDSVLARRLVDKHPELPVGALADDIKAEDIKTAMTKFFQKDGAEESVCSSKEIKEKYKTKARGFFEKAEKEAEKMRQRRTRNLEMDPAEVAEAAAAALPMRRRRAGAARGGTSGCPRPAEACATRCSRPVARRTAAAARWR